MSIHLIENRYGDLISTKTHENETWIDFSSLIHIEKLTKNALKNPLFTSYVEEQMRKNNNNKSDYIQNLGKDDIWINSKVAHILHPALEELSLNINPLREEYS